MRRPRIRDPISMWDILAALIAYLLVEYIVLQITGDLIVRQELVVIGIVVVLWVLWAALHVLKKST
ncbi:hypothetical protein [Halalkalicoccus paucihalophilus]|nr:hypothetical protein [Halalkalicoccus paucihalophilus]